MDECSKAVKLQSGNDAGDTLRVYTNCVPIAPKRDEKSHP